MKGQVFGGIVKMPSSPLADMHGLVRVVIRSELFTGVIVAMERLQVRVLPTDLGRTWGVSSSHVENEVTTNHYGEVFTCPVALAYLKPDHYTGLPFPKKQRAKSK